MQMILPSGDKNTMKESETFSPSFFDHLKNAENNHFWFEVRRKWIFDKINKYVHPPAQFLEIGCGTGNVSSFLSKKGYNVTGCEYYQEAIDIAWPGFSIVKGDALNTPFSDHSFDIVGLFDVIEHFEEDMLLLLEANRVLKDNGYIAITVPAGENLWSSIDEESFHKRRYTSDMLNNLLREAGFMPCTIEHMFISLYVPMKLMRYKNIRFNEFEINQVMNAILKGLFHAERIISRFISLPVGTSIVAIAQKQPLSH